ncbi:phosphoribosyltransferase [Umezakia ovalisporum]|uniref:phosphoribosyltransferase n=1 Tax=Umezakia ovalisporum TaxID=75695 RepID=UPI0024758444|nr:phosphoribosyltransferase [Umezakia ovalisporum]MDH6086383.1 phosphoribosyltransferase [Umezakia ovalisporum TAC611]MDH6089041.1 phosphoribosyltransferase [Umezakia ovalisporum Ak1311]MDH6104108.1 phosphoribosyltransferase [Umezakia ovalisporum ANA283AFssAo]
MKAHFADKYQENHTMLFKNRTIAGQILAGELTGYANRSDVIVLALPRGGVPIGYEVAKALNAPLDVLVVRKLGVPQQEELAMGAISSGGVRILNEHIVKLANICEETIATVAAQEQRELERRENLYRGHCPFPDLQGRIVILVDDGLATGATMWAAVASVRRQNPAQIVIAVPVAASATCRELEVGVDKIVCAATPEPFYSVGLWYEDFPQTTDDEVRDLLAKAQTGYQPLSLGA